MNKRVLFVDDDPNLLSGIRRHLRKHFEIQTATSGAEGLLILEDCGPFAVIVSDMQMPEMNGAQFLSEVRRKHRDSTRIMLTGDAGQKTAIDAVNCGEVFRFANKPCPIEKLRELVESGIEQYRLVTAEKTILSKTLGGSVGVLTEILSLSNPKAFGRTARVRALAKKICDRLSGFDGWEVELAAMLFPVGYLSVPESILDRINKGEVLSASEQEQFDRHATVGSNLINRIPRLQSVARIVAYQGKAFDGSGYPKDEVSEAAIPIGARILKLLIDFDALLQSGVEENRAAAILSGRSGHYDPEILEELNAIVGVDFVIREIPVTDLEDGMLLESNLCTMEGEVLLAKGRYVSAVIVERLHDFMRTRAVRKTVQVRELSPMEAVVTSSETR
ncbi:response regulator [bacterium]|nr:response regulator [bacterium]